MVRLHVLRDHVHFSRVKMAVTCGLFITVTFTIFGMEMQALITSSLSNMLWLWVE